MSEERTLTRRQMLGAAGTAGAVVVVGGIAPRGLGGAGLAGEDEEASAAGACVATPSLTEGPYWVDERLNRSDVIGGQPGIPLNLAIDVYRQDASCAPLQGAVVDIWHANASGIYSDVSMNNSVGQTFLRGYQTTDASGRVNFKTIYPGWYQGRAMHIHVRVRVFSGTTTTYNFTTQLFFDENTNGVVNNTAPYNTRGTRTTTNSQDNIFSGSNNATLVPLTGDVSSGFSGEIGIGVTGVPGSAGGGGTSDKSVGVTLEKAKITKSRDGRRTLSVTVKTTENAAIVAGLYRGTKNKLTAKKKTFSSAGTHVIKVPIGLRVPGGRVRLDLSSRDSAGNAKLQRRVLRIPSRG